MIIVWSNENCVQCERTKKFLDDNKIPYESKMLADDVETTKGFIESGFRTAPIVVTPKETWSGFKLDKLKSLVMEDSQ